MALGTYGSRDEAIAIEDAARVLLRGEFGRTILDTVPEWAMDAVRSIVSGGSVPDFTAQMTAQERADRCTRNRAIRERYAAGGVIGAELAAEFGMSKPGIYAILRNRSDELQPRIDALLKAGKGNARRKARKVTPDIVRQLRRRYQPHVVTVQQLADEFGLSASHVASIVNGYTYREVAA